MFSSLHDVQEYLESFIRPTVFERIAEDSHMRDPLDRMRVLLRLLGNPEKKFKSIQVSGTSGKGSTSYLLSSILTKAGYKTGLVTSPHLQRITERMQISMEEISLTALIELINLLIPAIEKIKRLPEGQPSYFELLTALAFMYFAREKVDIAVVEVGLEGKYDATNVLDPLVVILTNISKDHTELLGETEEKIAAEALSIIRKGKSGSAPVVVTGITQGPILQLLQEKADQATSEVVLLERDFGYTLKKHSREGTEFSFWSEGITIESLQLLLKGDYQVSNASLALAAIHTIQTMGFSVSSDSIKNALQNAFFPGRFEVISYQLPAKNYTLILDGAHNVAKMQAFLQALQAYYSEAKKTFIIGFKKNKDVQPMLDMLFLANGSYIFTEFHKTADYSRTISMELTDLKESVENSSFKHDYTFQRTVPEALSEATKREQEIIVITGSLYLVGEARDLFKI